MTRQKLYTVDDLVDSFIETYKLNTAADNYKNVYQQYLYRILHTTKIWENAIVKSKGKKTTRYFTEQQKRQLEYHPKLHDYLRDNSTSPELQNSKRYKEYQSEIESRRNAHISCLEKQETSGDEDDAPFISDEQFQKAKHTMMLEALFNLYFSNFDDALLLHDMSRIFITSDELGLSPEDIEAENRYSHPEGSYFKRKTD